MSYINLGTLRAEGRGALKKAGIQEYSLDADVLLMHKLKIDKNTLLTNFRLQVSESDAYAYTRLINARCKGCPIAYLTGRREFMSISFMVNANVLIPRPDTEILVETILLKENSGNHNGLEIGIGSGCISISLEYYGQGIYMRGVDISKTAVWVALQNYVRIPRLLDARSKKKLGLIDRVFGNSIFRASDMFENVPRGKYFDFIVSNPPYIETNELKKLPKTVKDYEPILALDGGEGGLKFYKEIAQKAGRHLINGGRLYFEIGYNQAEAVKYIMTEAGFGDIEVVKDLAGHDRVVYGKYL